MNAKIKSGAMAGGAALIAFGFILKKLIDTGAEFGRALGAAAVKFPEGIRRGTKAFKELNDAARAVGRTTEFTSTEAAKGLNFLAKAGFTAAFSMRALPKIIDFATASELEFAEAADIASDALGAFGLDSTDPIKKMKGLSRIMDVLTLTSIRANTSVPELFEAIKKSAPLATAAGVALETYAATMAQLAGSGIKSSVAGTGAKRITLALAGIGSKAASTMKKLGVKTADATGKLRDQFDVLDDLRKALAKVSQQKRLTYMEAIFGKLSLASAAILLGKTTEKMRALRKEFENSTGTVGKIATEIRGDLKGSLDSLGSAIESVSLSIMDSKGGSIQNIVDSMTRWVRANEGLISGGIATGLQKLIDVSKFLWKNGDKILKAAAAYTALAVGLKAVGLAITAIDLALKASAFGNIVTFFILWGAALGVGVNKMMKAVEASKEISAAMGNYGRNSVPIGATPGLVPADPAAGGSRQAPIASGPFNNRLSIDFKDLPKGTRIRGELDDSIELNTGYSGGAP
jgi:TP901 family phage tail tape measure protein